MSFETGGLNLEGLARALQGQITLLIVLSVLAIAVQLPVPRVVAHAAKSQNLDSVAASRMLRSTRLAVAIACLMPAALLIWQAAMVASVNRMPRADVEKSQVYEQMKANSTSKPQQ